MKLTHAFAIGALALSCAAQSAHATVCNGVTATLDVTPPHVLSCGAVPSSFMDIGLQPEAEFLATGTLTSTSIVLAMDSGFTGGFASDALWSFTLAAGSTFDPTVTELSDTFALDSTFDGSVPGGASFVGFANAFQTAIFQIIGANHPYDAFTHFEADYKINVITPVPEPETWAMMLGGLGLLAFVRRRRA